MSYRIRNWSEYNAGLKQRGSLTLWMSPAVLANWKVKEKTGKPGGDADLYEPSHCDDGESQERDDVARSSAVWLCGIYFSTDAGRLERP